MPKQYTKSQLELQRTFSTEALGARLSEGIVHAELSERDREFIESLDQFILATVDATGQPTCSYKGGDAGFVRVVDPKTIHFPVYNGNGMYLSAGNIADTAKVGLLFIDFETPHRLRVEGSAQLLADSEVLGIWPEAELVVAVEVSAVYVNCPRYVHRRTHEQPSRYLPRRGEVTPLAEWKRVDAFQDVISPSDASRVAVSGGTITLDEYRVKLSKGDA